MTWEERKIGSDTASKAIDISRQTLDQQTLAVVDCSLTGAKAKVGTLEVVRVRHGDKLKSKERGR